MSRKRIIFAGSIVTALLVVTFVTTVAASIWATGEGTRDRLVDTAALAFFLALGAGASTLIYATETDES